MDCIRNGIDASLEEIDSSVERIGASGHGNDCISDEI